MPLLELSPEILNQPRPLVGYNAFDADAALREALVREGGAWGVDRVRDLGAVVASAEAQEHSARAQRNLPVLRTHDRYGHRVDQVEYDPSFHWMLRLGVEREVHSLPWRGAGEASSADGHRARRATGSHVVRAALFYLMNELDTGPTCPLAMNYAAVPTIRQDAGLAARWEERITRADYDGYAQAGMVMTEKQGGSDLRANTTRAEPAGDGWYELTGHKWFCTHPVFDFFFTLARTEAGPTCFVAERPHAGFRLQRLKDKLGGRCLASSEVEFDRLPARALGPEGRGVPAIAVQINYTRLDTTLGVAGMMRRTVAEAVHHVRHRFAFGRLLAEQPLMRNVIADLALESEASMAAAMRVARSYETDDELPFRRLGTAVMKYWVCKRGAPVAVEALECLGGNGYVEEARVAQFYRDVEIGTVWEGSGNVAALDVLRAMARDPEGVDALLLECDRARGADRRLDAHLERARRDLAGISGGGARRAPTQHLATAQWTARRLVEDLAVALEASLLVRHSPPEVADAFCASRLRPDRRAFGALPHGVAAEKIVDRALAA